MTKKYFIVSKEFSNCPEIGSDITRYLITEKELGDYKNWEIEPLTPSDTEHRRLILSYLRSCIENEGLYNLLVEKVFGIC